MYDISESSLDLSEADAWIFCLYILYSNCVASMKYRFFALWPSYIPDIYNSNLENLYVSFEMKLCNKSVLNIYQWNKDPKHFVWWRFDTRSCLVLSQLPLLTLYQSWINVRWISMVTIICRIVHVIVVFSHVYLVL